jgi:hypothetical protein
LFQVVVWEPDGDDIMLLGEHIQPALKHWRLPDYTKWEVMNHQGFYVGSWGSEQLEPAGAGAEEVV